MPKSSSASKPKQRMKPVQRALRVYRFDPVSGSGGAEELIIRLPYEELQPGPIGAKLAVLDYDGALKVWYPPIDLEDPRFLADAGEIVDEGNPHFHQQMSFAVAMQTILRFESALGREIHWRKRGDDPKDPYYGKLRIFPHALQEANAFFDPDLHALLFGYFPASDANSNLNLPDQTIFTCLSYDIVAHETTHAILHATNPHFEEPTGFDAPAFHEAFADIVAIFQHFTFEELLIDAVQKTGGVIYRKQFAPTVAPDASGPQIEGEIGKENPLVQLARQFGDAMGKRGALRSALGTSPGTSNLDVVTEAHERGAILVAAVFDAFFSVYVEQTQDLIRSAYPDGKLPNPNFLNADLARRLAREAAKTADVMLTICVRALDYCPPVDIEFGDYLRALVTADIEIAPGDQRGYRQALIQAFRSRGIRPHGVPSFSEQSLRWQKFDPQQFPKLSEEMSGKFLETWVALTELENAEILRDQKKYTEVRSKLYQNLWQKAGNMSEALGLVTQKFAADSFACLARKGPDGYVQRSLKARFIEKRECTFNAGPGVGDQPFTFYGGCNVVVGRDGIVTYVIGKGLDNKAREQRQREYLEGLAASYAFGAYKALDVRNVAAFSAVHRGY